MSKEPLAGGSNLGGGGGWKLGSDRIFSVLPAVWENAGWEMQGGNGSTDPFLLSYLSERMEKRKSSISEDCGNDKPDRSPLG